ncbi:uncharacterized protein TNCV_2252731 [Trichonephila clavipes]|nr:uncharacterized protein TNCV_2252731 [Trichonephila clavipes]
MENRNNMKEKNQRTGKVQSPDVTPPTPALCLSKALDVLLDWSLRCGFLRNLNGVSSKKKTEEERSAVAKNITWSTLCKKSHGIPSSPRAAAVAKFRLLTGHDCLCAHLFRFNLVTSPICVLCDTGQDMTAAHLDECSALNDLNCIVKGIGDLI